MCFGLCSVPGHGSEADSTVLVCVERRCVALNYQGDPGPRISRPRVLGRAGSPGRDDPIGGCVGEGISLAGTRSTFRTLMQHRFRYLDERGRQVEVEDLASLREHVRAGKVDDQTLLYDALTEEWAPAEGHPAYRLLDDPGPQSQDDDGAGAPGAPNPETDLGDEPDFPDLDITLAPSGEFESTEEVVEKLLREREKDRREGLETLTTEPYTSEGTGTDSGLAEPEAPHLAEPEPPASEPPVGPAPTSVVEDELIRPRRRRTPSRPPSRRSKARKSPTREQALRGLVALAATVAVVVGIYGIFRIVNFSGAAEAATDAAGTEGRVRMAGNPAWAAAEGGAFGDMVAGMDSLRRVYGVARIPSSWLAGPYLADAGSYPEIHDYWTHYEDFVDAVRSQDTALFRRSFVDRLKEEELSGPMVSIRLARALETFRESQPARDTVYERMEDLAGSSLDLHELLVDRAPDIEYDPVTEERASRQPILEAWSDDAFLRQSIWSLLDRITANLALLEYDTGTGRSDLTERLFQELKNRSSVPGEAGG